MNFLQQYFSQLGPSFILFSFSLAGFVVEKIFKLNKTISDFITTLTFSFIMPVMLFNIMRHFSQYPAGDYRLVYIFFGCCFLVYFLSLAFAKYYFKLSGSESSVFAISGIFSNNVMIGIPMATVLLGKQSIPFIAMVVAFNAFLLWSLVSISIEFANMGKLSITSFLASAKNVVKNPIIIGIVLGLSVDHWHINIPNIVEIPVGFIASCAGPFSLFILGIALAQHKLSNNLKLSFSICSIKLLILPVLVFSVSILVGLPELETNSIVLLSSIAIGVNVYIMAYKFQALESTVASSLLISTVVSVFSAPLLLTLTTYFR